MKKQAKDLEVGDLLLKMDDFNLKPTFVTGVRWDTDHQNIVISCDGPHTTAVWSPDTEAEVATNLLTPAQKHADDLLSLVIDVAAVGYGELGQRANELLDAIDPPKPPDEKELLAFIESVAKDEAPTYDNHSTRRDWAKSLVKRMNAKK